MVDIKIIETANAKIAEAISEEIVMADEQATLDLMADVRYYGVDDLIIHKNHLLLEFFNLSPRLTGKIPQKFSNYFMRLAIVGDFSKYGSKNLKRFISESNMGYQVFFVENKMEAI